MGNSRKTGKEEYFTLPKVAQKCIDTFMERYPDSKYFLEPAAGNGSFSNILRINNEVVEFDVTPRTQTTKRLSEDSGSGGLDFIKHITPQLWFSDHPGKFDAVISNPPFGRASNLAIDFFNHATQFSDVIAFIVPSSWENRFFIHDKLDLNYHNAYSEELPKISFVSPSGTVFEGQYLNCVFQIWERRDTVRDKMLKYRSTDFKFVRPTNVAKILAKNAYNRKLKPKFATDPSELITIRTHGSRAGEILENYWQNPRTVQWILPIGSGVKEKLQQVDFSDYLKSNAYIPSLAPAEIAWCYDISH